MISRFDDLRTLQLSLENVGPFRDGVEKFRFMGTVAVGREGNTTAEAPANLYMLLAMNGSGKTTILRTIYSLMKMTGDGEAGETASPVFGQDSRAQLDLRVTLTIDDVTRTTLVSIWHGSPEPVVEWSKRELDEVAEVSAWAKIGYYSRGGTRAMSPECNEIGREIREHIQSNIGRHPTELYGLSSTLPSVLFFPANRAVLRPVGDRAVSIPQGWGYQPGQLFESDGPAWGSSIDSALVWLEWLGDGRLEELLRYVNTNVFHEGEKVIRRPRRDTLATMVSTKDGDHPLDELSHGERSLLQLYVRTVCNMTSNSVILIDEIENHLHTKWLNSFFGGLKELLRDVPSLSVIFTTHNRELMKVFDHTSFERGLIKGGYLVERGIE